VKISLGRGPPSNADSGYGVRCAEAPAQRLAEMDVTQASDTG
jgi:hypothetical protein